jgi:hypothetical protein
VLFVFPGLKCSSDVFCEDVSLIVVSSSMCWRSGTSSVFFEAAGFSQPSKADVISPGLPFGLPHLLVTDSTSFLCMLASFRSR